MLIDVLVVAAQGRALTCALLPGRGLLGEPALLHVAEAGRVLLLHSDSSSDFFTFRLFFFRRRFLGAASGSAVELFPALL